MPFKKLFTLLLTILLVSACQSVRTSQPISWPEGASIAASHFKHMVLTQGAQNPVRLHVYIEGDGLPFRNRFQIATDPSPRELMMLQLMKQDKNRSLYLGRPCYFTSSNQDMADEKCNFHWWTDARYSDEVVTSMVDTLRQHLKNHPARGVTLIGHSGGGTIATLMAQRMPEVDQLVTLAANLDTQAWTRYHHFTPLRNSLNPAAEIKTATPLKQIHFMGNKDKNIPPELAYDFLTSIGQQANIIKDADHNCCWEEQWPSLLLQIEQQANRH
ncbi:MAG: alpha/beta fold hydrolase [Cellvibrio sp.]